jgi:hypothetical protein
MLTLILLSICAQVASAGIDCNTAAGEDDCKSGKTGDRLTKLTLCFLSQTRKLVPRVEWSERSFLLTTHPCGRSRFFKRKQERKSVGRRVLVLFKIKWGNV